MCTQYQQCNNTKFFMVEKELLHRTKAENSTCIRNMQIILFFPPCLNFHMLQFVAENGSSLEFLFD